MEIAPLIHSRTLYCDFNQNFAVRPDDLNVTWARNKILPAMSDVDILNGVRRVVGVDGTVGIAGIACNFRYFVENYLSADEREDAKNYLHDERGREVKIFLGYVFKSNGVPDVSNSKLWQMFKENLAPEWERETVKTVIAKYQSCGVKNVSKKPVDKIFYSSDERTDIEIFEQCLANRKNFCSNVDAVKIFESGEYNVITAPEKIINRLKSEAQKKTPSPQPQAPIPASPSTQVQTTGSRPSRTSPPTRTGGISPTLMICAIVLIVIIAVLFFVTG